MAEIDPATVQWREEFEKRVFAEFGHVREKLDGISGQLEIQNGRLRDVEKAVAGKAAAEDCQRNTVDIARLKTWVPLVGGLVTIGSIIATAVVQVLMK